MSRTGTVNCGQCQTRFDSSTTVERKGHGTTDDPYRFEPILDDAGDLEWSGDNPDLTILRCGPNGFGAFIPPRFMNPPAVQVYATLGQIIPFETPQALIFNEERYDTDNMHVGRTDPDGDMGVIRLNTAGVYFVTFNCRWQATGTDVIVGDYAAAILKNGAEKISSDSTPAAEGDTQVEHSLSYQGDFEVGDFLSAIVKHDIKKNAFKETELAIAVDRMSPVFAATFLRDRAIEPCI